MACCKGNLPRRRVSVQPVDQIGVEVAADLFE